MPCWLANGAHFTFLGLLRYCLTELAYIEIQAASDYFYDPLLLSYVGFGRLPGAHVGSAMVPGWVIINTLETLRR